MRYLIISDIHGNWEALAAVRASSQGRYDQIICCGDVVGYGADPNEVTNWVRANVALTIRGNHDRACATLEGIEWFNPLAEASARWTHDVLSDSNREWLAALPPGPAWVEGFQIVHGSPVHEDEYIVSSSEAKEAFERVDASLTFFGHTHLQGGWQQLRRSIVQWDAHVLRSTITISDEAAYLVNPGSVGQPRDGNPEAAYAIYDSTRRTLELARTEYDVSQAQMKVVEAGLPIPLAERLMFGR